jgi:hypothetical protein
MAVAWGALALRIHVHDERGKGRVMTMMMTMDALERAQTTISRRTERVGGSRTRGSREWSGGGRGSTSAVCGAEDGGGRRDDKDLDASILS